MRMTLENYLSLQGVYANNMAEILGISRETIRKYRDTPGYESIVVFDLVTNKMSEFTVRHDKPVFHWEAES